jgi:AcrR family transcriptional regulator
MSKIKPLAASVFERVEPGKRKAGKRHIMSVALSCFDELGIEATTIETIRDRAASSIGAIYHHFKNKEGLIAALYFAALDDQLFLMLPRMETATGARDAIHALVQTYLEWVSEQPQLAKFLFHARTYVAGGPFAEDLAERNKKRYGRLLTWLLQGVKDGTIRALPRETYASLLVGQMENYCRAWLSGRVETRPTEHLEVFSDAARRSVST